MFPIAILVPNDIVKVKVCEGGCLFPFHAQTELI